VTKLGASVSGDFPKLGELIIPISTEGITPESGDTMYFLYEGYKSISPDLDYITLRGDIEFSDNTKNGALGYSGKKYLKPNQTGSLVIANKYKLTQFALNTPSAVLLSDEIDLRELTFSSSLLVLSAVAGIPTGLSSTNYKIKGNLSNLKGKSLTSLNLSYNIHVEGNIDNLAQMYATAVTKSSSSAIGTCTLKNCTGISGTVEGLVAAIRALQAAAEQPQTSGEYEFKANFSGTPVTFNGAKIALTGTDPKLSWTANTITYKDVTINA
jgi:hypothetical protein